MPWLIEKWERRAKPLLPRRFGTMAKGTMKPGVLKAIIETGFGKGMVWNGTVNDYRRLGIGAPVTITFLKRLGGPWKQGFIQGLGLHVAAPRGSILWPVAYYSHKHRSNFEPVVYESVHHRSVSHKKTFIASKRQALKEFRKHRDLQKRLEKRNRKSFENALEEQRAAFFDDDIWELMTEEEKAEKRRHQIHDRESKKSSDMRVFMRKMG